MYDPDKYKATRTTPSQARGKERVRVILAASLDLFREQGFEEVTTNDIAERAGIPIGSLYRYFPNKDAIITALTELYIGDISRIFAEIGEHPFLNHLSWDEVLILLIDSWVNYSNLNGPFAFLYAEKANPRLNALHRAQWQKFVSAFIDVLKKHCPEMTDREGLVCFNLASAAVEMGVSKEYQAIPGPPFHHEISSAIAGYMIKSCARHAHSAQPLASR